MSVSKMKRLTLVGMKRDTGKITEKLMWLGCVEIEKTAQAVEVKDTAYAVEGRRASADVKLLEEASALLIKLGATRHGLFSPLPTVTKEGFLGGRIGDKNYSDIIEIAHGILERKKELDSLSAELNAYKSRALSLSPFLSYDLKLSENETARTSLILGSIPKGIEARFVTEELERAGSAAVTEVISSDAYLSYVSVIFMKEQTETALKTLSGLGFNKAVFPDMTDTPKAELSRINERLEGIRSDMEALTEDLEKNSAIFDEIQIALDMACTAERLAEEKEKLFSTERTVIVTGWVPSEYTSAVKNAFEGEPVFLSLSDPDKGEDVPVHLVNGQPAGYFESVVEMYSPPAYGSFDPTRIMTVFFFIIFGLMLADVVYGAIISLGALFLIKKANLSEGVRNMCSLFAYCGISCIIFGILFGSYLGDLPARFMKDFFGIDVKVWAALDIMTEAIIFLILSLVLVLSICVRVWAYAFTFFGQAEELGAIFDEGSWFFLFGGAGLFFISKTAGITVASIGVAMLILTQGRHEKNVFMKFIKGIGSLYGLINYMSDLLSYSRIMALGLSSAVVASVFNILATMGGKTVLGVIMLVLIVPLGHLLNLAINLLGAFVHTSRLQYVEFFGKFFEDGGRAFKPIKPALTRTVIKNTDAPTKGDPLNSAPVT